MAIEDRRILEPPRRAAPAPSRRTPVCWLVIAASVFMAFVGDRLWTTEYYLHDTMVVLQPGALHGPLVEKGQWRRVLWTTVEHGGLLHLLLNMSAVYTLGRALEASIGVGRFALVCVGTALGSSALALFVNFDAPTVGASGMILGWAGAMLPIATRAGRDSLITWLVQIAIISALPGISWAGHLGGFLAGLPMGFSLRQPERFRYVAPVTIFVMAAACVVAGSWRV